MASGEAGPTTAEASKAPTQPAGDTLADEQGRGEAPMPGTRYPPGDRPGKGAPGGGTPAGNGLRFGSGPGLGAVLRRKAASGREPPVAPEQAPLPRALRRALARAAQADCRLPLAAGELRHTQASLAELLDMPEDMALLAVLEGPGERLGLMALGPAVTAALIEQHTTGSVSAGQGAARRPTRTDAAMAAGLIDRSLTELQTGLCAEPGAAAAAAAAWAAGYRYASFLEEPRALGLLLEDVPYEVATATVDLANGARRGTVLLAMPAAPQRSGPGPVRRGAGAVAVPARVAPPLPDPAEAEGQWKERIGRTGMASPAALEGVLCRLKLPLSAVLAWKPGDFVLLPGGALDRVALEGGGRVFARARLGQSRGRRALRLQPTGSSEGPPPRQPPLAGFAATASTLSAGARPAGPGRTHSAAPGSGPPDLAPSDFAMPALAPLPDLGDDILGD
jgi:flagellar motor switch protein FliM